MINEPENPSPPPPPPSLPAIHAMSGTTERLEETEKKKALLVYQSYQPSVTDDDDDDEDDDDDVESKMREEEHEEADWDQKDEADSTTNLPNESPPLPVHHSVRDHASALERIDVDMDEDEISTPVPSDDDLDSVHMRETSGEGDKGQQFTMLNRFNTKEITPRPHNDSCINITDSNDAEIIKETDNSKHNLDSSSPLRQEGKNVNAAAISRSSKISGNRRASNARRECEVCHEGRGGRRAMICAVCKCMYHSSCYRKNVSKMVHMTADKQWYCPDCDPDLARRADGDSSSVMIKGVSIAAKASRKSDIVPNANIRNINKDVGPSDRIAANSGSNINHATAVTQLEDQIKWVSEVAFHGGKKVNWMILEQTNEMLATLLPMLHSLDEKIKSSVQDQEPTQSPVSVQTRVESSILKDDKADATDTQQLKWMKWMKQEMMALKDMTQQLQVTGIKFEIDMIREIQLTPSAQDAKGLSAFSFGGSHPYNNRKGHNAGERSGSQFRGATGTGGGAGGGSKVKNGASRLYSSKQIQKLEEWYQKSSRPEASEIQAMYRIINSAKYADRELQPDGISVKQIRIWFDNRRAKERLDYMRLKMKDVSTADMDPESVKKMKAAYIDEAKEVLEARVSRLRENSNSATQIVDEADLILVANGERPLSAKPVRPASTTAAKPVLTQTHNASSAVGKTIAPEPKLFVSQKKRIRMDSVASVRKAVKDARDTGKSDDEIKAVRAAAIEAAKDRLFIPTANARFSPTHPLGKSEVTHIKFKMLKLLEEGSVAENVTDIIELLSSSVIPRKVLIDSGLTRQLELALKAYRENKELVKQAKKVLEEFQRIIERGEEAEEISASSGSSQILPASDSAFDPAQHNVPSSAPFPQSPAASSDQSKRVRSGKFSIAQLKKLEKYFKKDDTPSKKKLERLSAKLSAMATEDGGKTLDYKQLRGWFYKRRSSNQPPHALLVAGSKHPEGASTSSCPDVPSSTSSSGSETESDSNESHISLPDGQSITAKSTPSKRKNSEYGLNQSSKRPRKLTPDGKESKSSSGNKAFNVKQLSTLIELYERNRNPSSSKLDDLVKILNQEDYSDRQEGACISRQQVQGWFAQRRAKEKKDIMRLQEKDGEKILKNNEAATTAIEENRESDRETSSARKELFGSDTEAQSVFGHSHRDELLANDVISSDGELDDDLGSDDEMNDIELDQVTE